MHAKDLMTAPVVTLRPDTHLKDVAAIFVRRGINAAPVVEDGHLVGIVSEADLIPLEARPDQRFAVLASERGPLPRTVREVMTRSVFTVSRDTDASDLLLKQDLDGRGAWLGGGRRRRDLAKAAAATAGELMTSPVVTVGTHQTVAEAANLLRGFSVNHLPVVDEQGRLAGIVSRGDLLRVFLRTDDEIRREVDAEVLGKPHLPEAAEVQVSVTGGVVRLDGGVERHSELRLIVDLVRAVDGVVGVDSRLTCRAHDGTTPLRLVR